MTLEIGVLSYSEADSVTEPSFQPKAGSFHENQNASVGRIRDLSKRTIPTMGRIEGRGGVSLTADWGGEEGTHVEIGISAEARDRDGSYVKVDVSQEVSDEGAGKGKATVSAGYE